MKNILKKSLSVFLTVLMVISCFSVISPITAGAIPATDSTYARGDKYGTPAYTGTGDRWFRWATGSDYVTVYYPSQIYLDVSETLQSAGYHFDVEWHYGDTHKYRILLGAPIWGDHRAFSGQPTKYYTMTNIFSDYAVDASLPKGAPSGLYGSTSSSTDYDLRIMGYGHANQGTDGFTVNNARHDKYVLFRTNVNYYNPASASIYLMGTPSSSYVGTTTEYNTSGSSIGSYGLAQNYPNGWKTDESATNMFKVKGSSSSYMEGQWIEMQWFVTVYDKSALNSEIVKAGQIISANQNYRQYVVSGSFDGLVQKNSEAQTVITTRATTQSNINNAKNNLYSAASGLTFGASNTALRELVSQAEAIINSGEYEAKYTENSRNALEIALADAKALSYYNSVPTYNAYNITLAGSSAASDQSAINSTANALSAAINALGNNIAFYTYNFNMADGSVKKTSGAYGYTIPESSIPDHSEKAADENYHYSYIWDKEINYTITGPDDYTEVLVTEGHDWSDWFVTADPDCDTKGEKTRECISCGYTETAEIPADGHTEGAPVISDEVDPSCSAEGSYRETIFCEICGVVISAKTVTVPKTEHTEGEKTKENEVAPSCTKDGSYDEVVRCTVCGEIISSKTVIVGAAHQNGEPEVQREESTCDKAGFVKTTVSCTVCGEVLSETTEELPLAEHSPAEAVKENEVEADCENDGSYDMVVYCSVCGEELSRETETVPATGHTEAEAVIENEVEADCVNDGSYDSVVYCSVCGEELSRETEIVPATGHEEAEAVIENEVEADCVNDGSYDSVVYCSVCGEELSRETETVPATGHTEAEAVIENEVEADCVNDGSYDTVVYCSVCGEEISRETETVSALGHDMSEFVEDIPATCEDDGESRSDCSRCDYYETDVIPATGHEEAEAVTENEVDADCVNDGSYDTVVYCTVCNGEISRETTVVPATGHKEAEAVKENEVDAECETDGSYDSVVYCSVCGEELSRETETVSATGHDWGEWETDIPASCGTDGQDKRICKNNASHIETRPVLATGEHVYATEKERVEAGCTEDGYVIMACLCGAEETTVLKSEGHKEGTPVTENEIEATCETDGSYDTVVYCTVCNGELSRETETVPALGHKDGEPVIENEVKATCETDGSYDKVIYCTVCGGEVSRSSAYVPAEGHKEEILPAVEVTCTEDGLTEGVKCSVCGEILTAQEVIPAEGHKMGEFSVTKPATCKEEGEERADCENCDYFEVKAIGKLAHNEEILPAVAPTCTESGLTEGKKCTVCGEIITAQKTVNALGHKLGEWVIAIAPTCTEKGVRMAECENCDYVLTENIPATDHEYDENGVCTECGDEHKCMHICHKEHNIFAKIVWTIIRFICSLFGVGRTCSCGEAHY